MRKNGASFDIVGLVQAMNKVKKERVNPAIFDSGETADVVVNRVHRFAVWRIIALSALTDTLIYKADDLLRKKHPELDLLRAGMMEYYEKFIERTKGLTVAPEDVMTDFKLKFSRLADRKLTAFSNRAKAICKGLGLEDYETIAAICCYCRILQAIPEMWKFSLKPLGALRKYTPDHVDRALVILDWSNDKAGRLLGLLDPEAREQKGPDEKLSKLYKDLVDMLFEGDELAKSMEYARKENGLPYDRH